MRHFYNTIIGSKVMAMRMRMRMRLEFLVFFWFYLIFLFSFVLIVVFKECCKKTFLKKFLFVFVFWGLKKSFFLVVLSFSCLPFFLDILGLS